MSKNAKKKKELTKKEYVLSKMVLKEGIKRMRQGIFHIRSAMLNTEFKEIEKDILWCENIIQILGVQAMIHLIKTAGKDRLISKDEVEDSIREILETDH